MKTLTMNSCCRTTATLLPNEFIDHDMVPANGEFVKVYLFLLRHQGNPCSSFTVPDIADRLCCTEGDVLRAFRYWESAGLLKLLRDADGEITGIELLQNTPAYSSSYPAAYTPGSPAGAAAKETPYRIKEASYAAGNVPAAGSAPAEAFSAGGSVQTESFSAESSAQAEASAARNRVQEDVSAQEHTTIVSRDTFRSRKEFQSVLFVAEQYLKRPLGRSDVDSISYFFDKLHMSADLVEYLIETCVENGHTSMHYIEKTALSWSEKGIRTVAQAKEESGLHSQICYCVIKSFGLKNRTLSDHEQAIVSRWVKEYGFDTPIIREACRRTLAATHQPSFAYADKILSDWHQADVHRLSDIEALDKQHRAKSAAAKKSSSRQDGAVRNLNNFERRQYDMDALEEKLLNSN